MHIQLQLALVSIGRAAGNLLEALQHARAHGFVQRADVARKQHVVHHQVARRARVHLADGDHGGLQRAHVAAGDGLHRLNERRGGHNGVDVFLRHAAVAAAAHKAHFEHVFIAHQLALLHAHGAQRQLGVIVQAEHGRGVDGLEQAALLYQVFCAGKRLFRGLKHKVHVAAQGAFPAAQRHGRAQQGRGVGVVPAGVHFALVHRGVRPLHGLVLGNGVNVGPQGHGGAFAARKARHGARFGARGQHLHAGQALQGL